MKKAFLLLITVAMLTGALWLKVSAASTAPLKATVYSEFFTDVKAGKQVSAQMSINDTNWQNLYCVTTEQPGNVSCEFPEKYAGQQIPVQLTRNKIMYVYLVNVPKK